MTDDISKVDRALSCGCVVCICEDDERCHGCGAKCCERGPHGIKSATTPAEVDAPGIDTANHAGVRVRGYTVEQYAALARQLAEAKADNERLRAEVGDWNVNGPALVQQLELSKQREAHFTTQMLEARNAQQQAESQLAEATRRLGEVGGLVGKWRNEANQWGELGCHDGAAMLTKCADELEQLTKEPAK